MADHHADRMNPKRALIKGALWSVAMRWSVKGLGLVTTLLLARILLPSDYGIVGMAMLVVGLMEVLVDFGVETGLIRLKSVDRDDIDSAWSLRIIQGGVVSASLAIAAPLAGLYFNEQRVVAVIWVFACCLLASSFGNIGITLARKNFDFALEFRYNVISKIMTAIVTIVAALLIRDYRALVIGVVTGCIIGLVLSYTMHPYRPSWNLSRLRSMWSFSKWLLVSGIGNFATRKVDEIVAGRIADAHGMGLYSVASDIGQLPTAELGPPMMRALLPTLSTIQDDPARMRSAVLKTLAAINTLTLAAGFGLTLVAESATLLLLGERWREAVPILAVFGIVGSMKIAVGPLPTMFLVLGKSKLHARIMWIEFAGFVAGAVAFAPYFGLIGLAYARLASALLSFIATLIAGRAIAAISLKDLVAIFLRPLVGVALMAIAITSLSLADVSPLVQLITKVTIGAFVYTLWIALSWMAIGRPDGLENIALAAFRRGMAR